MDVFMFILPLFYRLIPTASAEPPAPSLDVSSSQTQTVRLTENTTLSCNISGKQEVSWYRLNSELDKLTLLIFGEKTRIRKSLLYSYNTDQQRLKLTANSEITEAYLTVLQVGRDDLGFYFCGTKADWSQMHFARPISLELEGQSDQRCLEKEVKDADGVVVERALMLVGVSAVALVFLLASIAAGRVIHQRAWRSGWAAGMHSAQGRSLKR